MEYVTLNNGIRMPKLGYGVYQTPAEDTEILLQMLHRARNGRCGEMKFFCHARSFS